MVENQLEAKIETRMIFGNFPKYGDPQYGPQEAVILTIGTPQRGTPILGNPHMLLEFRGEVGPLRNPTAFYNSKSERLQDMTWL